MNIVLSEQQQQVLDQEKEKPPCVVDPRNNSATYTTAVRALNAVIGVWFSCFTHTLAPSRSHSSGQTICGVGGNTAYTSFCAS